ncbi:hypothetical protein NQ318_009215 [Aromia moschata]|uniref:Uncharacterized protein n=1 Tax=Aromia moschata TaxID=1265417 RepID=A0AAV8XN16_9CUCU|nr:hypothetical protein NQ318_009215 [Aromia moschata]
MGGNRSAWTQEGQAVSQTADDRRRDASALLPRRPTRCRASFLAEQPSRRPASASPRQMATGLMSLGQ